MNLEDRDVMQIIFLYYDLLWCEPSKEDEGTAIIISLRFYGAANEIKCLVSEFAIFQPFLGREFI